jgi:hypothetical protein
VARRERQGVWQAIEADWLTSTRDGRCAEPCKARFSLSVPVTCVELCRAEEQGVEQATGADWLTSTRDFRCAQPSKTQRLRMCLSL